MNVQLNRFPRKIPRIVIIYVVTIARKGFKKSDKGLIMFVCSFNVIPSVNFILYFSVEREHVMLLSFNFERDVTDMSFVFFSGQ